MNRSFSNRPVLILLVIVLVGTLLRFYKLDTYSIFFDEKSTMVVSQGIVLEGANQKDIFTQPAFTPADFWKPKTIADYYEAMTRSDIGNSPVYYLLVHIWMDIFGISDFSARSMSVLFSVLIIVLTYLFARRYFSETTALIAAAIVAIEPFFIAYSHQARNYSLTFFLTLQSTYYFLQIVENENAGKRDLKKYLLYVIVSFLCPLSHFLTASVFIGHGLYALFFLKARHWLKMLLAGALAMSGIVWWLLYGGGQWTLHSLDHQAKEYKRMADTMPFNNPYGNILPATPTNVLVKLLPMASDLLIFLNGLYDALAGKKNLIISLLSGLSLAFLYHSDLLRRYPISRRSIALAVVAFAPMLLYTQTRLQFVILAVAILLISMFLAVHKKASPAEQRRLWLFYIMATVPTLFLVVFAFKAGHTYGLTQRYSGFSFPYVIIFVALVAQFVAALKPEFKALIGIVVLLQLGFVALRLKEFYEDRSPKYGYFANPRPANPYYAVAQEIKQVYQPGDTIFYGAPPVVIFNEMDRTFLPYSVQDAQLTNLYLPKDAQYVQVMDTVRINKIILKQAATGKDLELADLTGMRF